MTHSEKLQKLKEFYNESDFRLFLMDLFKKMGFTDVFHTHRFGSPELGKDIIARLSHEIEGDEWYAFVVKFGKIKGGSVEIETIKAQIKQAFEYPYEAIDGTRLKINKVKVITNDNFTGGAQEAISKSDELKNYNNISYWWNEPLIEKIDKFYADFWLPGDEFSKEYSKDLKRSIREEFELKDLSYKKIEDQKVKKLLDIFIDPYINEVVVETKIENGKEIKNANRKKVSLTSLLEDKRNTIITGEPGSGKTRIINNLVVMYLNSKEFSSEKILPIKLRGKEIKAADFDINKAISTAVKIHSSENFDRTNINDYEKVIFVDEIDVLNKDEKVLLFNNLKAVTSISGRFILTQRKNDNIDLVADDNGYRTVRINNFNLKQIETFIEKYFEGTGRGEKFIQVLKESNLFSQLPTTPLTITLISLLYDENGYEIPATITDIYDDFTQILFGKLEVKNRAELLILNIKKRLFTHLALKMLDEKKFEISFEDFKNDINEFLRKKGYVNQSDEDLLEIVNNCGLLYIDHTNSVGFKQQAFIEYLASIEIYDHTRNTHYVKLLKNFNDVSWQNTAIFFAGRSKDFPDMIQDLLIEMPNNDLRDWFINVGGMGYLSQALYLTDKEERKKLIRKSLDNMVLSFDILKQATRDDVAFFKDMPLPLVANVLDTWFVENFKSITLRETLNELFDELALEYIKADVNDFVGDFKLFLIATALTSKNINDQTAFLKLIDRKSFIKNPVLMIAADFYLQLSDIDKKTIDPSIRENVQKQIKHHIKALKYILKEPAYRFTDDYKYLKKNELGRDKGPDLLEATN